MKKVIKIVAVVLVLVIVMSFAKNIMAGAIVSAGVKAITGLKLEIKNMNVGVLRTLIGVRGLKLFNPPGFKDSLMADVPELYVNYDLGAFFKKKVHLNELKLNLKELIVVKNKKGELNLNSLKVVKKKKETAGKDAKKTHFQIDALELKIGRVIYKDYSTGGAPKVREFNVDVEERYENITDPRALGKLIIFRALVNTTISSLANFDLGPLKEGLNRTLNKATKIVQGTAGKALEAGKEIGVKAEESAMEAAEKVKGIIGSLLPFGKEEEK